MSSTNMFEKYREIANAIFKSLGTGHTEFIYHRAMEIELQLNHIIYESEKRVLITYEREEKRYTIGEERIDLYIPEEKLIIELKAIVGAPKESEIMQLHKYYRELKKMGIEAKAGIVINFPQSGAKPAKMDVDYVEINY